MDAYADKNVIVAGASVVVGLLGAYVLFRPRSTLRDIAGPPPSSWVYGNMLELFPPEHGIHEFNWLRKYGPVYRLKGCFGQDRLIVSDPIALQYLLNSAHIDYAPSLQNQVVLVGGEGTVMALKGDMHKRFRNALNVGFTASAVRRCRPAFGEVAEEVSRQLEASNGSPVDICPMLGRATLTAISKAVLGCSAEDLGEDFVSAALNLVSTASNQSTGEQIIADAVSASLPEWLMLAMIRLPTPTFALLRRARALAQEIGERVVSEKRRAAQAGTDITGDLYGVLVDAAQAQAQTQMHLGRGARVLTDRELAEQTQMLMVAGQDTTANVLTFVLLELAKDPKLQNALRAEIRAHMHDAAEGNYDALPLLNAIIKETLRMYPVEPLTDRVALQDAVIPLGEPLTTIKAERISSIPIRKGQIITVGIGSYQRLESRWGADAHQFKPTRWLEGRAPLPGSRSEGEVLGPYANLLAFSAGAHTCLGWRFAILELQVILCGLVGKFMFARAEDFPVRIRSTTTLLPTLANGKKGAVFCVTRAADEDREM
ncbi:Cytochrome P450 [Mycena sanguinolenta]|uniref:Cytochrome P450 n=1 Tax=Mycena sanguinolenta TaxID=230812 RepID=A0A8H6Y3M7_9AGAR|nr:Cytochrome P450 [Mycena sanguinolenta]